MKRTLGHRPLVHDAGRLKTFLGTTGGGSGTGPADATYLTLSLHADLSSERKFVGGDGLVSTDDGANGDFTLDVSLAGTSGLELTGVSPNKDLQLADSVAGDGLAIASKVLAVNTGVGLTISGDAVCVAWQGSPTTIVPDANTAGGSSNYAARTDHTHAIACAAPAANSVHVSSSAEGNATSFARSNHTHNLSEAIAPSWTGIHSFDKDIQLDANLDFIGAQSITTTSGGNLSIVPAGDIILDPDGKDVLPQANYEINLGLINKKYLTLHCAELWVETLVAQDTIATIGGRILVGPTTTLTSDLAPAGTTIYVKHNQMVSGDRAYMEADGKVEFFAITSAPSGSGPYSYSVTRNLDGSGANQWYAGDAVFNTGTAGKGFIDLYSLSGVRTGYGPTIVGQVRNSSTYNDWTEHWAIGNLNALYGYGTDIYGAALGKYGASYVLIDATSGVRIWGGATQRVLIAADGSGWMSASNKFAWDTSGNITLSGSITITGGSGIASLTDAGNLATVDNLDGVGDGSTYHKTTVNEVTGAGRAYAGLNASSVLTTGVIPGSAITPTGAGLYLSSSYMGYYSGSAWTTYMDNTGKFYLGGTSGSLQWSGSVLALSFASGATTIDGDGITIGVGNNRWNKVEFKNGSVYVGALTCTSILNTAVRVSAAPLSTTYKSSDVTLYAYHWDGDETSITLNATASPNINLDVALNTIILRKTWTQISKDLRCGEGLFVGSYNIDPDDNDIHFMGNLKSYKNSTNYNVWGFSRLTAPLTSVSWDATAKSSSGPTVINLNSVFGVPKFARAVLVELAARDSAAWGTTGLYFNVGPTSTYWYSVAARPAGGQVVAGDTSPCPTTLDGSDNPQIYFKIGASGSLTMDCWLRIWGYWI